MRTCKSRQLMLARLSSRDAQFIIFARSLDVALTNAWNFDYHLALAA